MSSLMGKPFQTAWTMDEKYSLHFKGKQLSSFFFLHRNSSTEGLLGTTFITVPAEKPEQIQPQAFWGL